MTYFSPFTASSLFLSITKSIKSLVSVEFKCKLQKLEALNDVIVAGLATVQQWLDLPQLGSAVVVTTDNQTQLAANLCSNVDEELWSSRREYLPELVSIKEAV